MHRRHPPRDWQKRVEALKARGCGKIRSFRVGCYRKVGRAAARPWQSVHPKPDDLCQQSERVAAGLKADMDLLKQVCGPGCPSFIGCPFLAMLDQAAKADVVIAASNRVFSGLPKAVARGIARATIEEDFTPHGIWIFSLSLESFRETALAKWPVLREGEPDDAVHANWHGCWPRSRKPSPATAI